MSLSSPSSTLRMVAVTPYVDMPVETALDLFKQKINKIIKTHVHWYTDKYVGTLRYNTKVFKGKLCIFMELIVPKARLPEDGYVERRAIYNEMRSSWLRLTNNRGELEIQYNILFMLK